MGLSAGQFNRFTFFKLPAAWWTGVRVRSISEQICTVTVKYGWRNQNPFNSMFWAVQGMAAELSTGALVINRIRDNGKRISMLVQNNNANFSKKARGKITFTCNDGDLIQAALNKTVATGEGQTFWMRSTGVDEEGTVVSTFNFEWTVRIRK
ncbi:DUF4442 domain-containing protein [Pricia sp. S334]|uniref:DUF4442 domain-containing protein n=1 Tax=Pricia mediterranea TaxID=3076079 RepID=A0ABU3L189_9FLAO|nr:DUF4442 domain-containing protein [Pricia sp. S334]MDT7827086.1 DUF4442 domain-containing protein [Pricia sp. S334]